MPLPKPAPRQMLHLRDIDLRGYRRDDGLMDIEAHMTDTKTYSSNNTGRGGIQSGEPLHDMWLRLTVDRELTILACDAAMDATPHFNCPGAAPNFQRLVGLSIAKGFLKNAMAVLGGTQGCTHLRELLQQLGTVAYQTKFSLNHAGMDAAPQRPRTIPPELLNSCYAYDENGPLIDKATRQLTTET